MHELVLAAPDELITRRNLHLVGDNSLGIVNVAADVSPGDVNVHIATQTTVLVTDHSWSAQEADIRQLGHGYLSAGWSPHENAIESAQVGAVVPQVTDTDRISLAAFDSSGHMFATHR